MFWGKFKTPQNHFFCVVQCFKFFSDVSKCQIWRMHTVPTCAICHHGRSMDAFRG
ncbi:hypothetical protein AB205_0041270 [Aquarana catesbeiana]|uniref:Uncharacterized protein n=1 Tax=Aquarana catesbeiana TaxID=8400 RepID=A0A2G9Q1K0_AQUCT|nr:hypothetical protein AB205_0041270 [Aquarana catesbeiana]